MKNDKLKLIEFILIAFNVILLTIAVSMKIIEYENSKKQYNVVEEIAEEPIEPTSSLVLGSNKK